mmetsp:Transcript_31824/g.105412  ORF Transcript_31824/g.105412 Transcript_31824/m.105412 type:complete len:394 (+) Transcript_31824:1044-2225(+)
MLRLQICSQSRGNVFVSLPQTLHRDSGLNLHSFDDLQPAVELHRPLLEFGTKGLGEGAARVLVCTVVPLLGVLFAEREERLLRHFNLAAQLRNLDAPVRALRLQSRDIGEQLLESGALLRELTDGLNQAHFHPPAGQLRLRRSVAAGLLQRQRFLALLGDAGLQSRHIVLQVLHFNTLPGLQAVNLIRESMPRGLEELADLLGSLLLQLPGHGSRGRTGALQKLAFLKLRSSRRVGHLADATAEVPDLGSQSDQAELVLELRDERQAAVELLEGRPHLRRVLKLIAQDARLQLRPGGRRRSRACAAVAVALLRRLLWRGFGRGLFGGRGRQPLLHLCTQPHEAFLDADDPTREGFLDAADPPTEVLDDLGGRGLPLGPAPLNVDLRMLRLPHL